MAMKITRALTLLMHVIPSTIRIIPCLFKKAKIGHAKVVFRFDDYGVWCNTDWLSIEEQVMHLHEKYNVEITFGVIPDSIYPLNAHILSPSVYPKDYELKNIFLVVSEACLNKRLMILSICLLMTVLQTVL